MMKKRLTIYLALSLGLTWLTALLLRLGIMPAEWEMLSMAALFLPAVSVIVARLATKEGVRDLYLGPNFSDNFLFYLAAWFLPSVVITLGAVLYFIVFPARFDGDFSQMTAIMVEQGYDMSVTNIDAVFYSLAINNVFIAPLINALLALGEELGWRGYLLPKLQEHMDSWKAVLLAALGWGLCRMPVAMLGFSYGEGYPGFPFWGMLAQLLYCLVVGVFLGYLTVRVRSALPAALASGAITAFEPMGGYLSLDGGNPFLGPTSTGVLGGFFWIVTAGICLWWMIRKPKPKKEEIRLLNVKLR